MNRRIWNFFEMAGKLTSSKEDNRRYLIGAVAIRKDGALVSAVNSCSQIPDRHVHAEYRLALKMDQGSTVYVARVRLLNGEFAMARPCFECRKILTGKRVKRVYYTISNNEYGVLDI